MSVCSSPADCSMPMGKGKDEEKPALLPAERSLCCPGEAHGDQPSPESRAGSGSSKLCICSPATVTSMLFMELNASHFREELGIHMHVVRGGQ